MLLSLATAALATMSALPQVDTTVAVSSGQRLEVDNFGGEVNIKTWSRNAVRVQADPSSRAEVQVSTAGSVVNVKTEGRHGPPSVDLEITAPAWMGLDLSGVNGDVTVRGARGPVTVETVQGSVDVTGGQGNVSLRSVQGSVTLHGARGRIDLHSVNEDVSVFDASGEITAETVNGEITLARVDATSLDASTVNGDLSYDGPIHNGGRYTLSSHNGDVTLAVAEGTSAAISVSTFNGEFQSEFPVTINETRKGKRFNFTIGSGSAQVTLESFQGTVALVRPGHLHRSSDEKGDDDDHDRNRDDDHDR
ncbi:MAG TPA: DUF4097 family beta strand repeat-containing protein [Gemmatimonadales bacterium]|nr:DUF4097 family beta strand repeat-containing protein [Gemmatimonadales bacterium]